VNTISHYLKGQSAGGRILVYFAFTGAAGILALVTGMGRMGALLIAGVVLIGVDVAIWLRKNPTLKQIERRRLKDKELSHQSKAEPPA